MGGREPPLPGETRSKPECGAEAVNGLLSGGGHSPQIWRCRGTPPCPTVNVRKRSLRPGGQHSKGSSQGGLVSISARLSEPVEAPTHCVRPQLQEPGHARWAPLGSTAEIRPGEGAGCQQPKKVRPTCPAAHAGLSVKFSWALGLKDRLRSGCHSRASHPPTSRGASGPRPEQEDPCDCLMAPLPLHAGTAARSSPDQQTSRDT